MGEVVARGDAEIGVQQISELLPVAGIEIVGPLPAALQKITTFSAGVLVAAKEPDARQGAGEVRRAVHRGPCSRTKAWSRHETRPNLPAKKHNIEGRM